MEKTFLHVIECECCDRTDVFLGVIPHPSHETVEVEEETLLRWHKVMEDWEIVQAEMYDVWTFAKEKRLLEENHPIQLWADLTTGLTSATL